MPYNVQFQVAALAIVCLTGLLLKRQVVQLYTQKTYIILLAAVTLSIGLDILSVVMIMRMDTFGVLATHAVCKLYLISIVLVAYALWNYAVSEVYGSHNVKKWHRLVAIIPVLAHFVSMFIWPIQDFRQGSTVYTFGICVSITYLVAVIYLVVSLSYTFFYLKKLSRYVYHSIWFLIGAWLIAAVIQLAHNEFLIVSFAMSIAMIYMYIRLENPALYMDGVCQTFNMYAYLEYLQKRKEENKKFWSACIQIEGMRFLGDTFGAYRSRELLQEITKFLKQTGDGKGLVFRINTYSFTIIYAEENAMLQAVEQIEARFADSWLSEGIDFHLDCGIAYLADIHVADTSNEVMDLLGSFAEAAVQKNAPICIDKKAVEERNRYMEAEKALQWAVETDSLQVYYQPIYSVKLGKIMALEALVRIVDESGRCFMPDTFIPLAEKNGMILKLGESVLYKVCDFMQKEKLTEYGIEYVEVNLSVIQCMQENLAKRFLDIMAEKQVSPYRINLEITETAAVHSEKILLRNMERLSQVGTAFSLDDYGTGYSSLSYVLKMPVKLIKLDKEMVWSYFSNSKSAVAMRHEIAMFHELGLEIVAEGVENEQQFAAMRDLGIDYIQGYYFSKPIPPKVLLAFLRNWL